jgi:hypothetical protein
MTVPLKEIQGKDVIVNPFVNFVEKKVLLEYDGPAIVLCQDTEGNSWLFKWAADTDDPSVARWIAVKISQEVLHSLESETLSLRDGIWLGNHELYIFDAKELFDPIEIRLSTADRLPPTYLPNGSWSINGKKLQPKVIDKERLTISLSIISKHVARGTGPSQIVTPILDRLQQYLRSTAHAINKTPSGRIPHVLEDWATMELASVAAGSFKMEWLTNSDLEKSQKLSQACEVLSKFFISDIDVNTIKEQIGDEGIFVAYLLADFISKTQLSISMSWLSETITGGHLTIDKKRADKFISAVGYSKKGKKANKEENIVTLTINPQDADLIRLPVRGTGGHQSLMKSLQKKLSKDNTIQLTASEVEKVVRYGLNYGGGGFQNRLLPLAKAIKQLDASLQTSFVTGTRAPRKKKVIDTNNARLDQY